MNFFSQHWWRKWTLSKWLLPVRDHPISWYEFEYGKHIEDYNNEALLIIAPFYDRNELLKECWAEVNSYHESLFGTDLICDIVNQSRRSAATFGTWWPRQTLHTEKTRPKGSRKILLNKARLQLAGGVSTLYVCHREPSGVCLQRYLTKRLTYVWVTASHTTESKSS